MSRFLKISVQFENDEGIISQWKRVKKIYGNKPNKKTLKQLIADFLKGREELEELRNEAKELRFKISMYREEFSTYSNNNKQ